MGVLVLTDGKTFLFRSALFVGLASVVATIIYLTPVPDQYPQSCMRPCHELDWPMICRVKLTFEKYPTLSRSCGHCPENTTDCYNKYCVTGDGTRSLVFTANRQFPGPNIQVCQNDIIVVDVVNKISGHSFGIHWRGQIQKEYPFMDGVPMVTQCPIPSFTTFQYKFRAATPGTHLWEANTGDEVLDNVFGGFIVRQPDSKDPAKYLYDTDDPAHIISVQQWTNKQEQTMLLINGRVEGQSVEHSVPASKLYIKPDVRHRFRLIYGRVSGRMCPVTVSIAEHKVLVIVLDGVNVKPLKASSIRILPGERIDFVVEGTHTSGTYQLSAVPSVECSHIQNGSALVVYKTDGQVPSTIVTDEEVKAQEIQLSTSITDDCQSESNVCLNEVSSLEPTPEEIKKPEADVVFYLTFGYQEIASTSLVNSSFIAYDDVIRIPHINNLTMAYPASPILTQTADVSSVCNEYNIPDRCLQTTVCECVHVLSVPLGSLVELVLIDQANDNKSHVFHLHGQPFYVYNLISLKEEHSAQDIVNMHKQGDFTVKDLHNIPIKDTVAVPHKGVSVLRFQTDNPGYWLLKEESHEEISRGMSLLIHITGKLPDVPENFPTCGNWIGPEFFLV